MEQEWASLRENEGVGLCLELNTEQAGRAVTAADDAAGTDPVLIKRAIELLEAAQATDIAAELLSTSSDDVELILRALLSASGGVSKTPLSKEQVVARVGRDAVKSGRRSQVGTRKKALAFEAAFAPSSRAHELFSAKMIAMKLKNNVVSDFINDEYTHDREKFKRSRARRATDYNSLSLQESFVLEPSGLHKYDLKFNLGGLYFDVVITGALKKLARFGSEGAAGKEPTLSCAVSPKTALSLMPTTRSKLHIPEGATTFCFAYPITGLENVGHASKRILGDHKDTNFLVWGGFLYFDDSGAVMAANALDFSQDGGGVSYNDPVNLPDDVEKTLRDSDRFRPASRQLRSARGVRDFTWLCPGEYKEKGLNNDHGGFAFTFRKQGGGRQSQVASKEAGLVFLISTCIDGIDMRGEVPDIGRRSKASEVRRADRTETVDVKIMLDERFSAEHTQQFSHMLLLHDEAALKEMQDMVLNDWSCDIFKCQEKTGSSLSFVGHTLLNKHGLTELYHIPEAILMNFLQAINGGYQENRYHNAVHAAGTVHYTPHNIHSALYS
jgi:hypothetical protein